jgi:hypothetical protein
MENHTIIKIQHETSFDNKSYLPIYHKDVEEKKNKNVLTNCIIQ